MYKRILVAMGGAPWSEAALSYAITLAAQTDAELCILTVLTVHAAYALPDVMATSDLIMESIEHQGQELLDASVAQAATAGIASSAFCKWGNIPETVLQVAAEEECDLIVLGSRMMAGRKRLRLGSISNAIAAKSHQPILIVKQPPPPGSDGFLWRHLLVATGGSPWSDAAVDYTLRLAQHQDCKLYLLSVEPLPSRRQKTAAPPTGTINAALDSAARRAAAAEVSYETLLVYGNTVEAITETALQQHCDLIVLGSRGLTGWKRLMVGSTSNAVTVKTGLPVLIVKRFMLP